MTEGTGESPQQVEVWSSTEEKVSTDIYHPCHAHFLELRSVQHFETISYNQTIW